MFALSASAKAGDDHLEALQRMESALYEEIRKLQEDDIPQAELEKAVRQSRAQFVYSTDSASSQAFMLGYLETIFSADMYDEFLDNLSRVTADDVRRVARTYLAEHNRTVGWFIPTEEGDAQQPEGAQTAGEVA